jgi:hypothetical protein
MSGLPWFVLAAGIVIVIAGFLMAAMRQGRTDRPVITSRMGDDDIVRSLKAGQGLPFPNLVISFGLLLILVSVVWRLVRWLL